MHNGFCAFFGVYAALNVNYVVGGTVTYQVQDVFVTVDASVYVSNQSILTNQETLINNAKLFEQNGESATTLTKTTKTKYADSFKSYDPTTGQILNPDPTQSKVIGITYGSYNNNISTPKGFAYYIVLNIKNYGSETAHAVLTDNINRTSTNSYVYISSSTDIEGKGENSYSQTNIVIAMSLKDPYSSVSSVVFDVPIFLTKETTQELAFTPINNGEEYSVKAINYTTISGAVVIPETYNGKPVTEIEGYSFRNATKITSVYIPKTIRKLGMEAFNGCTSLTKINIPDEVENISMYAFASC